MTAPLDGILVLDLTRILAGPFCTMMLGDLGARVIKVEHPEGGDVTRGWGPPDEPSSGLSAYYLSINRNKESIALDLATEDGAESVRVLARRADAVLENFPPGGLEKFGLSLEHMRKENPRLVTASITGYGRVGPEAAAPGFDLLAQAGTGIMAITGEAGGGPAKVGVAVSDLLAGCYAAIGVAAALAGRERAGTGAHIEIDLFSSSLASLINVAQAALVTGREAERHGNAHAQIVPYRTFTAADGDFVIAAGTDRQFSRLAALLGHPEWAEDPRYRTNTARLQNRAAIEAAIGAILRREPRGAWLARLRQAGVPAGPVAGPLEALRSETARALGAVVDSGGVSFVASPIHVAGHVPPVSFPPALDADGEKLRREFELPGAPRPGETGDGRRKA
jgi:crotonobetainyl-CoA:carnitine CoA-transferase CaiB-like acyl-CoA transferase